MPTLKTVAAFNNCLVSGAAIGGFAQVTTQNPRISIPIAACVTVIQFVAEMSADQ
jgi:hypothetical protein